MTMLQFGEPEGNQTEEPGKITRGDLLSYENYLDGVEKKTEEAAKIGKGYEARLVVPTGDPVVTRSGKRTNRGKEEAKHDRLFHKVAAERQYSVRIIPEHLNDGTTMLRIAITGKREFTELTTARRDRGRINWQAGEAQKKADALKAQGKDRQANLAQKKADGLVAEVAELDKEIAEMESIVTKYAQSIGKDLEELTTEEVFAALAEGNGKAEVPSGNAPEAPPAPPKAPPAKVQGQTRK